MIRLAYTICCRSNEIRESMGKSSEFSRIWCNREPEALLIGAYGQEALLLRWSGMLVLLLTRKISANTESLFAPENFYIYSHILPALHLWSVITKQHPTKSCTLEFHPVLRTHQDGSQF